MAERNRAGGAVVCAQRGGESAFYRWLSRDWRPLFPALPERTRLFRLLALQRSWTDKVLATPSVLGVVESYGIELVHPLRQGRSRQQIGCKGKSNHRWIVRGKLCLLLNQGGLVVGWVCAGANTPDTAFHSRIATYEEEMIVFE